MTSRDTRPVLHDWPRSCRRISIAVPGSVAWRWPTLAWRWLGAGLTRLGWPLRIASQLHFPALVQATTAQRAAGRRQAAVSVRRSIPAPGGQQPATGGSNGLPRAPSLPPSVAPSQPLLCRTPVRFSSLPPPPTCASVL